MVSAFALAYILLQLRAFIMATGKDRSRYYRVFIMIMQCDETDGDSGKGDTPDRNSNEDEILIEWPRPFEFHQEVSDQVRTKIAATSVTKKTDQAPRQQKALSVTTSRLKTFVVVPGAFVALMTLQHGTAVAQSTLFNIPSTDVISKKKVYFEFDFISHLEGHEKGGIQTYATRVVVGLGKGVEAGANLATTHSAAPTIVYVQPNMKWQFYSNEESGTTVTVGGIGYVPAKDTGLNDSFGFLYGNASKKFKGDYGPRLTVGGYGLVGVDVRGIDKGGAMVGYEQPLAKKASFVADWFSGKNGFGYVTPGFSFSLPKNSVINIGYSIGNHGKKNNALYGYFGITL
jgi:hypothetical protein